MCKPCLESITPFHQCHLSNVLSTQQAGCPPTPQLIPPSPPQSIGTLGLTQCLWRARKKSLTFSWKKPSTEKLQSLKFAAEQAEVGQAWCYLQSAFPGSGEWANQRQGLMWVAVMSAHFFPRRSLYLTSSSDACMLLQCILTQRATNPFFPCVFHPGCCCKTLVSALFLSALLHPRKTYIVCISLLGNRSHILYFTFGSHVKVMFGLKSDLI